MLDFESCQSPEKLVIDAEIITAARRLVAGIEPRETPIALPLMRRLGHKADYLADPHTLRWFREELVTPSAIIDRGSLDAWRAKGRRSAFDRARDRVRDLVKRYQRPARSPELLAALREITLRAARQFGMTDLPRAAQD
jgi:trimethylamine--corrinoid protein Co-methyltransferase